MSEAIGFPLLTIFTPSYNRSRELIRLYGSLLVQNDMRFEWVIVDDGSTDDTRSLIARWLGGSSPFPIRYIYQENSGKHVAHNRGAQEARGGLFMCVDSDDWLEANAVATILADASALAAEESLLYPKLFTSQGTLDKWFPEGTKRIELSDMRMRYRLVVETAICVQNGGIMPAPLPGDRGRALHTRRFRILRFSQS